MKRRVVVCFSIVLIVIMFIVGCKKQQPIKVERDSKPIQDMIITIGNQEYTAKLYETEAAQAIAQQLPLTLDMTELNGNEKYAYLAEDFKKSANVPKSIKSGELMLYGSNCLVLFYEDFLTSYSYTEVGYITDTTGLKEALGTGDVTVSFKKE